MSKITFFWILYVFLSVAFAAVLPQNDRPITSAVNFNNNVQLKNFLIAKNCPLVRLLQNKDNNSKRLLTAPEFSKNNNQEALIDEKDNLKTDGQYIYIVSKNILQIMRAYPSNQMQIMSRIPLQNSASSLFIDGKYIAVIGHLQENGFTWVNVYDTLNKRAPSLIKKHKFSGYFLNARKNENTGFLYIFSAISCTLIPWYSFTDATIKRPIPTTQIFSFPNSNFENIAYTNIMALNLRNPLAGNQNIISVLTPYLDSFQPSFYMTENSIYLTKVENIFLNAVTKIYKISVSMSTITPLFDGSIPGMLNSQLSLDEYNGVLRVAITRFQRLVPTFSEVHYLDSSLRIIGTETNLAPLKKITSALFVNRKLYLGFGYFDSQNEFIVVSLEESERPRTMGKIDPLMFSEYLHQYNSSTVISIGRDTAPQQTGLVRFGYKVSLLNVQNMNSPTILAEYVFPLKYSFSIKRKPFLFINSNNLLVLPIDFSQLKRNPNDDSIPNSFAGSMVLEIKRTPNFLIELKAIVNHRLAAADSIAAREVANILQIDDLLYTKSNCLLRIHNLSNLSPVANLDLDCQYNWYQKTNQVNTLNTNVMPPFSIYQSIKVV